MGKTWMSSSVYFKQNHVVAMTFIHASLYIAVLILSDILKIILQYINFRLCPSVIPVGGIQNNKVSLIRGRTNYYIPKTNCQSNLIYFDIWISDQNLNLPVFAFKEGYIIITPCVDKSCYKLSAGTWKTPCC